jgi:hypothetical protein
MMEYWNNGKRAKKINLIFNTQHSSIPAFQNCSLSLDHGWFKFTESEGI